MSNGNHIRVFLVDDQPIVRAGLAAIIGRQGDMEVVGEASDGHEAVAVYAHLDPDVTIIELRKPRMSGVEALTDIISRFPTAKVIVLTAYDTGEDISRCLRAGAKAFLVIDVPQETLTEAIRNVAAGCTHIPTEIATKLAARLSVQELSRRETEVLHLVADGKSNLEIGKSLSITEGTVKSHVYNIFGKMAVSDRTQAVTQAIRRGLVML